MKTSTKTAVAALSAGVLAILVPFVGSWEGLETKAYKDIVGVWTVCYGETRGVEKGDEYTKAECDAMLAAGLEQFNQRLGACLPAISSFPVKVQASFVSWSYNVGTGAACSSTLVRKAKAGDLRGACNELPKWNKAGGRVVNGLTRRRAAERAMCLEGVNGR